MRVLSKDLEGAGEHLGRVAEHEDEHDQEGDTSQSGGKEEIYVYFKMVV